MPLPPESQAPALRRARQYLIENGQPPENMLDTQLVRSWQRSLAAGLTPAGPCAEDKTHSGTELGYTLAHSHELLAHAAPVMEYLFEQVRGNHSMVILADHHGVLVNTMGDANFLNKAERVSLSVGASWHEESRGTNAIGTALVECKGVEIHGPEHFLEHNDFLTCAAAPIMGATGNLVGVLDISGDQRSRSPHTLGLVNIVARMIENRLVTATCKGAIRLYMHPRAEGIGTVAEGIIVLSEDGCIMGGNRAGFNLLGMTPGQIGSTFLAQYLQNRLSDLLAAHQRRPEQALPVSLHDGTPLLVRIHMDRSPQISGYSPATTSPVTDALSDLDTGDKGWRTAAEKVRRVLDKPIPLLLYGESGVGKEIFARACHESSQRRGGRFVPINCAALPENLIEAELFGYAPGAFTGAHRQGNAGRLREAHGGTLFLDEIGDMSLAMQTRLLRVLQERQVIPLGGGKPVDVDFALICATHHNLRQSAETGAFRKDLYYRINGLTLNLPPLRDRSDFLALTTRILNELAPGRHLTIETDLLKRLAAYSWPGNLRQYSNMLRTAVAMLDPWENEIEWRHLPDDIAEELNLSSLNPVQEILARPAHGDTSLSLAERSMAAIQQTLEETGGNVSETARRLGISRQTLYRKLRQC